MNTFLTIVWWTAAVLFLSFLAALFIGAFIRAGKGPR
jgi:hypothetical protein